MAVERRIEGVDVISRRKVRGPSVVQARIDRLLPLRSEDETWCEETGTVPLAVGYFTLERMRTAAVAKVRAAKRNKLGSKQ
jgi:hypothetical protein